MAADVLAPYIARLSATKALTVQDKWVLNIHKEVFQLPAPLRCWEIIENGNIFEFSTTRFQFFDVGFQLNALDQCCEIKQNVKTNIFLLWKSIQHINGDSL